MIVIDAYDVSLRASKQKQDQLQTKLETVQREAANNKQEWDEMEKKMAALRDDCEQQAKELERHQHKGMKPYMQLVFL